MNWLLTLQRYTKFSKVAYKILKSHLQNSQIFQTKFSKVAYKILKSTLQNSQKSLTKFSNLPYKSAKLSPPKCPIELSKTSPPDFKWTVIFFAMLNVKGTSPSLPPLTLSSSYIQQGMSNAAAPVQVARSSANFRDLWGTWGLLRHSSCLTEYYVSVGS